MIPDHEERWAPIPGFPYYEVSDLGRVRSLRRLVGAGAHGAQRWTGGRLLNAWLTTNGYRMVALGEKGKRSVHQLVLAAFVGPQAPGVVSRHLNDDREDNRLVNLAYGTQSENNRDSIRNGHNPNVNKTHCPHGHEYSGANLRVTAKGRYCRTCSNSRPGPRQRRKMAELANKGVAS